MAALKVGDAIPSETVHLTRTELLAYAEASGDHNPIHLDDAVAAAVGLPGVIAHGMLTMGHASRIICTAVGGVENLRSLAVRFTRPVVVPPLEADVNTAEVNIGGTVTAFDEQTREATISISASFNGQTVLARAEARVVLR